MRTVPFVLTLGSTLLLFAGCPEGGPSEGEGEGEGELGDVAYYPDAANVLNKHCVQCHSEGGIAPFRLDSYANARGVAAAAAAEVEQRYMPPYNVDNSGACNTFQHARWLDDSEIDTLIAWSAAGAPEGDPANAPTPPASIPSLDRVDGTVEMAEAYTPDPARDDYRCFVVDPGLAYDQFVTGFEVVPGTPEIVHHLIMYRLSAADAVTARALDAAEAGPGYTCFGGPRVDSQDIVIGWAPGSPPSYYPGDTGIRLEANQPVVIQLHYNPAAASGLTDLTRVDLKLEDTVLNEAVIVAWGDAMQLAPGQPAEVHAYTEGIDADVTVWGVFPHMHTLGRSMSVRTVGNQGGDRCLIDVPRWDFNWQQGYMYEQPIELDYGTQVRVECVFDTTSRTTTTYFGENTDDEMCVVLWLYSLR